jgi:LPXTG-motif cell wall-anchored protein
MRRILLLALVLPLLLGSLTPAAAAGPDLTVLSPAADAVIEGTEVAVRFEAKDFKIVPSTVPVADFGKRPDANKPGEGHIHLTLDLWPLVVWEKGDVYTFTDVPPGAHQLKVELVNNDHSSFSPPTARLIQFRTVAPGAAPSRMPNTGAESPTGGALALFAALTLLATGIFLRRRETRMLQ